MAPSRNAQFKDRSMKRISPPRLLLTAVVCLAMVSPGVARNAGPKNDPERVLARVAVRGDADREAARSLGLVVEDYGPFLVVAATRDAITRARTSARALDIQLLESEISLRALRFDPLTSDPARAYAASGGYKAAPDPTGDTYLVQFAGPARDAWLSAVERAGVQVVQYVPHQAFIVRASASAMTSVSALPYVRWTGLFHPAYKLGPELLWSVGGESKSGDAWGSTGSADYDVAVVRVGNLDGVAAEVARGGGRIHNRILLSNNYFNVLRVRLSPAQVRAIAALEDVVAIDPYVQPTAEDERAAQIVAGNYSGPTTLSGPGYNPLNQFGVDGANVTVAVVDDGVGIPGDGGFYVTAANAAHGPLRGANSSATGHGHLNASIIAGATPFSTLDPTGYNYGSGVAPGAHILNIPFLRSGYSGSEADTCNDTVASSGPNGVPGFISNNSWGSGLNGNAYDSLAAQYDGFVRDASAAGTIDPLVVVFSAGNQGASGLTRPKMAKNVITVAASKNYRTELSPSTDHNNIEDMADFSSRGPAADGRIKPEISAPGAGITGGRSGADSLFGNIDANHRWSSGTSHAAPQVAGGAALFVQWWKSTHGGANPSPALVKAALVNGAVEMTGALVGSAIPNGVEGWGRMNLKNVLNTGTPTEYVNETVPLASTGSFHTITGTIQDPSKPVRVSLSWLDPPGVSDPALVNNLDLEVTINGITYKGNVFSGGMSASGGVFDNRNNLENVYLPAGFPAGTPFSIKITAAAINGDGILGNADTTDQHFALIATNAVATPAPVVAGSGATITSESCAPGNGVVDPGETVTIDVTLANIGTANTANLVATLAGTGGVTSPSGPQTYGAMTAGGGGVTRSFTFTASGDCGDFVTASLQLQDGATSLGSADFQFRMGALGTPATASYGSGAVNVPIPASGTTGSMTDQVLAISDVGAVQDVNVRLRLNHSYDGDIAISLVGPDGTTVALSNRRGGSGDNFGSGATDCSGTFTVFDDAAATAISAGSAPFAGTFRPDSPLTAFNGKPSEGNWTLKINDAASGDSGALYCWQLEITRAQYECCGGGGPPVGDTVGLYQSSTYFLRTQHDGGNADITAIYGVAGWKGISGDWNGDGTDTIGAYDAASGTFFLRNANSTGSADATFIYGGPASTFTPLSGDWDGDGDETVGLYDPASGTFFLRNANGSGTADLTFQFGLGNLGYQPIVGDWDGNGTDTIGLYDPATGTFFLRNANASGNADASFLYGLGGQGYVALAGDWNDDGTTTIGLYHPASGVFFLRNSNSAGDASYTYQFGLGGAGITPLVGDWNG
jgi:subtilisin-like proprotein convertase family protein